MSAVDCCSNVVGRMMHTPAIHLVCSTALWHVAARLHGGECMYLANPVWCWDKRDVFAVLCNLYRDNKLSGRMCTCRHAHMSCVVVGVVLLIGQSSCLFGTGGLFMQAPDSVLRL